jgi:hypothetical protein
MSNVFATLFGGGTTSSADTSNTNAKISELTSNFTAMKSTLSTAISSANMVSPDLKNIVDTTVLTDALNQTDKLTEICKNLSTEDCNKKQILQQAENDAAQLKFFRDSLAASIKTLSDARVPIQSKLDQLVRAGVTGAGAVVKGSEMIPDYEALISRIDGDITVLSNSVPYINPPASTSIFGGSSSGSASTRPDYVLPSTTSASSYTGEFERLNIQYRSATGVPVTADDINAQVIRVIKTIVIPMAFYTSLAFAAFIGGVALSNFFIEEKSLYVRLYYFFWGMLGFPASLAYCAIYTPFWVSMIPMYARITQEHISLLPEKVKVSGNKAKPIMDGIPAPNGMIWIKESVSDEFFSYLISLAATTKVSSELPAVPANHWVVALATSGQQLWSLAHGEPVGIVGSAPSTTRTSTPTSTRTV